MAKRRSDDQWLNALQECRSSGLNMTFSLYLVLMNNNLHSIYQEAQTIVHRIITVTGTFFH